MPLIVHPCFSMQMWRCYFFLSFSDCEPSVESLKIQQQNFFFFFRFSTVCPFQSLVVYLRRTLCGGDLMSTWGRSSQLCSASLPLNPSATGLTGHSLTTVEWNSNLLVSTSKNWKWQLEPETYTTCMGVLSHQRHSFVAFSLKWQLSDELKSMKQWNPRPYSWPPWYLSWIMGLSCFLATILCSNSARKFSSSEQFNWHVGIPPVTPQMRDCNYTSALSFCVQEVKEKM